jgi:LPS sulfotransferase NodH
MLREVRPRVSKTAFRLAAAEPRFLIVTTGRTGSELLVSLLDSHPRIRCDSEILSIPRAFPGQLVLRRSALARAHGLAYGFKLVAEHARLQSPHDREGFLRGFADQGFRIVVLERRDLLQQVVSSVRGIETQHHHRLGERDEFRPMQVDPVAVLCALAWFEESVNFVRSALAGVPVLDLVYEDDLLEAEQQQRTADRVCTFLGLPPAPVKTDLVKIAPRSLADQLENFDEVAALLSATRFARLLAPDQGF